ncbi:MAG: hypothetical protein C0594_02390 [Marinilabiliales bacterium]|nr:MAG: hypothetical protein C0594_02390 [Marinilabiliales bacterium]
MKAYTVLLILLIGFYLNAHGSSDTTQIIETFNKAQNFRIEKKDSALLLLRDCYNRLNQNPDVNFKKKYYSKLAYSFYGYGDLKTSRTCFNKTASLILSEADSVNTIVNISKTCDYYENCGKISNTLSEFGEARKYFNKSLHLIDSIQKTKKKETHSLNANKGSIYNNIGTSFLNEGAFDLALENYQSALSTYESILDTAGIYNSHINIGLIHWEMKNFEKAAIYYNKALLMAKAQNSNNSISACLNNLGILYYEKSQKQQDTVYEKTYIDTALIYYKKSLEYISKESNLNYYAGTLVNMGIAYKEKAKLSCEKSIQSDLFNSAADLYVEANDLYASIGNINGVSLTAGNISALYLTLYDLSGQKDKSLVQESVKYGLKAYNAGKEIHALSRVEEASHQLYEAYEYLGNYKVALQYAKEYIIVQDSMFFKEKTEAVAEMETKYQTEKVQHKNEKLEQQKLLDQETIARQEAEKKKQMYAIVGVLLVLVVVIVFSIVLFRQFRAKRKAYDELEIKNEQILEQKDEITAQRDQLDKALITLKSTQEQLIESEKMASLGNLVAGVAHEINTPVGIGITASTALIEETKQFADTYRTGKMTKTDFQNYLQNMYDTGNLISKNMQRTGNLIQTFKQISTDQQTEESREFNIKSYFEDLIQSFSREAETKKATIDLHSEDIVINSYPGVFALVLSHLVSNSLVHGFRNTEKGIISIKIEKKEKLQIQFSDNGNGISHDLLPSVFEPFTTSNKQLGAGLGLNIVYNLVKQKLNGDIRIESIIKAGTTVFISIPDCSA